MISNTLYRPKLEKGARATEWSPCSVYTSSLIKQTSDGILLEVDKVVDDLSGTTNAQFAALELTVSGITQEVASIKNTASGDTEAIGKLQVTVSGITQEVTSVKDTLSGHTEDIGNLQVTAQRISATVDSVKNTVSGHTKDIGNLQVTAQGITASVDSVKNTATANAKDIGKLQVTAQGISATVDSIKDTVSGNTEAIGNLQVTAQRISASVDNIKDTLSGHTKDIGSLQVTAQGISASVDSVKNTASGNTEAIGNLQVTVSGITQEVASVKDTLSGHTEDIGNLQVTVSGITQEVKSVKSEVSGNTKEIGKLQVTTQGISATVDSYIEGIVRPNMLSVNGWVDKEEQFVMPTEEYKYFAEFSTITSPKVYLDANETYTVSQYNAHYKRLRLIDKDNNVIAPTVESATTETYKSIPRYYETYQITTAGEYKIQYGNNTINSEFYRPKLEKGDIPTPYAAGQVHYNSLIQQTSQEIKLQVKEQDAIGQFKQTGLDITNGKIELNADNTEIHGNLELYATNDSDALTLFDDSNVGKTTVTSHNIGKLKGQSQNTSKAYLESYTLAPGQSTIFDLDTIHFGANSIVTAGQNYTDRVCYAAFYYYDSITGRRQVRNVESKDGCIMTLQFVNTTTNTTYTLPSTTKFTSGYFEATKETQASVTIVEEGDYKVQFKFQWSNGATTAPSYWPSDTLAIIQCYFTSTTSTKTLIGADGLYTTTGAENYLYHGTDGFAVSYVRDLLNGYAYGRSSVGAMNGAANAETGVIEDKYLYTNTATGPSHIAPFKGNDQHWTNSQNYGNVSTFMKSNLYSTEPWVPLPSTDIIVVLENKDARGTQNISLADLEYYGHIVTIKTLGGPCDINLLPSTGGIIIGRRGGQFTNYNKNLYMIRMVFMDMTSSGPDEADNYNGVWLILDEELN